MFAVILEKVSTASVKHWLLAIILGGEWSLCQNWLIHLKADNMKTQILDSGLSEPQVNERQTANQVRNTFRSKSLGRGRPVLFFFFFWHEATGMPHGFESRMLFLVCEKPD